MNCPVCSVSFVRNKFHPKQKTCGNPACYFKLYRVTNADKIRLSNKINRERRWFGGKRDAVLRRDKKCMSCGSTVALVVHHKDGHGRGVKNKNNDIDNLQALCNSCHSKLHSTSIAPRVVEAIIKNPLVPTRKLGLSLGVSHTTVRKYRGLGTVASR